MPDTAEIARYRAAWKARRRRSRIHGIITAGLIMVPVLLAQTKYLPIAAVCAVIGFLCACAWVYRFRCPRCDKIFTPKWIRSDSEAYYAPSTDSNCCAHCGLKVDEIPGEPQP